MPPKEYEKGQLFFGIVGNGQNPVMPLYDYSEIDIHTSELEDYEMIDISKDSECTFSFNMDKKLIRNLNKALGLYWLTNNWRKLHGLPMKRRCGK